MTNDDPNWFGGRPLIAFPPGLFDRDGRRLRPGSAVVLPTEHGGGLAEVVGWAGRRGVEVYNHNSGDVVVVSPLDLERSDLELAEPITTGWAVFEPDDVPTLLLFPLGGRDLVLRDPGHPGPFPPSRSSTTGPGGRTDVKLRDWADACQRALADVPAADRADLVARYLDAPLLRRVLVEAVLSADITRLAFVLSDQDPPDPRDGVTMLPLLLEWMVGQGFMPGADDAPEQARQVLEVAPPVVLQRSPHITDAVMAVVRRRLPELASGCGRVAVVHAGGTPAMTYGTMLAAVAHSGLPVRLVQVPEDRRTPAGNVAQPLIEIDIADQPEVGPVLYPERTPE